MSGNRAPRRRFIAKGLGLIGMLAVGLSPSAHAQTPDELARIFAEEIPAAMKVDLSAARFAMYGDLLHATLGKAGITLATPQYLLLVDRAVETQIGMLVWHDQSGPRLIGAAKVSTGVQGRKGYFLTPEGVFDHLPANADYRAQGTKNANGVRGYGTKGMRVFDFGWQPSVMGWGSRGAADIRLQMHATDPDLLESRLGQPASKGCVRIPGALNKFIDRHGLLDAAYVGNPKASWLFPSNWRPVPAAGRYMVVVEGLVSKEIK